jgi:recombinational DNA repair protein (RecF pathway)
MIGATAAGVRLSRSKLRYYLQDNSYTLFSVVKGKEVWRITGAKEIEGAGEVVSENKKLYVRILSLLKRLLPGEEKNEKLFDLIHAFHTYLSTTPLEKEKRELVVYVTVLRILHNLGYVSQTTSLNSTFELNEGILAEVLENKEKIVKEINNGLQESQL